MHFYKVSAKFSGIGDPALEVLHLNAYHGYIRYHFVSLSFDKWAQERHNAMKVSHRHLSDYSTKSISGKYNERILEFVKSFVQHFNSKTLQKIKNIVFDIAIDTNEVIWLLGTREIFLLQNPEVGESQSRTTAARA